MHDQLEHAGVTDPVGVGLTAVVPLTANDNGRTVPAVGIASHAAFDVGPRALTLPVVDPFTGVCLLYPSDAADHPTRVRVGCGLALEQTYT